MVVFKRSEKNSGRKKIFRSNKEKVGFLWNEGITVFEVVLYILSSAFQVYELRMVLQCFLGNRKVKIVTEVIAYLLLFCIMTVPYYVIRVPIITFLCSLFGVVAITSIYTRKVKEKILAALFCFVIMMLTECVVAVVAGYMGEDFFKKSEFHSTFGTVVLPIIMLIIVLIIRNLKNIGNGQEISLRYWFICVALPVISFFLFWVFYDQEELNRVELLLCTAFIFLINLLVFLLYDGVKESLAMKYKMREYEMVLQTNQKLRQQNHDFLKHISMIAYLNEKCEYEQVEKYLFELKENVYEERKFSDSQNIVFDHVLNYKIQQASQRGINVNLTVKIPFELEVSVHDINILFSNLIDNAMEALENIEKKQIDICVIYQKKKLFIEIQNPYDVTKIKKQGDTLVTNKDNRELHGYGLKNVKKIVDKYDGVFDINYREGTFCVNICLFLK